MQFAIRPVVTTVALTLGLASAASAAPIVYTEAVGGDLSESGATRSFVFDVGLNTVSGTLSSSDFDTFAFTVPVGQSVLSASVSAVDTPGVGDVAFFKHNLRAGSLSRGQGSLIQALIVPSPGLLQINTPLTAGNYNLDQVSIGTNTPPGPYASDYTFSFTVALVPEPTTLTVCAGLALVATRRRARASSRT